MTLHTLTVITLVNIIAVCVERFRVINDDKCLHDMLADQMIYELCDIDLLYLKVNDDELKRRSHGRIMNSLSIS